MKFNVKEISLKAVVAIIFLLAAIGIYKISVFKDNAKAQIEAANLKVDDAEAIKIFDAEEYSAASYVVQLGVYLFGIAIILVILSSIYNMFVNPKGILNAAVGVAVLLLIVAVSYYFASDVELFKDSGDVLLQRVSADNPNGYTEKQVKSVFKLSGTGLLTTYTLLVICGLFFVVDLIKSLIKS